MASSMLMLPGRKYKGPDRAMLPYAYEDVLLYTDYDVHTRMPRADGLTLPPGFTLLPVKKRTDNDSLFRALAILKYGGAHNHDVCRQDIVAYVHDHLISMYPNQRYHGEDCKALTTTVGRTMNMIPILNPRKVCTFFDALTQPAVIKIMTFLSETPEAYRERMTLDSRCNGGNYLELVAAVKILGHHVRIIRPPMTMKRIDMFGLELLEQNTLNLVCLPDKQYHACHFSRELQLDTAAMMLLPPGCSIVKVGGGVSSMYRALAHIWKGSESFHAELRRCTISHICMNWNNDDALYVKAIQWADPEETSQTYRKRMLSMNHDCVGESELVAAGRVMDLHIKILHHSQPDHEYLTTLPPNNLPGFQDTGVTHNKYNTAYLLCVADGRYHALNVTPTEALGQVVVEETGAQMETRSVTAKRIRLGN